MVHRCLCLRRVAHMRALHQLLAAYPLGLWLLIDAVTVYRITRLITRDSLPLVARPRDAAQRRWGDRALGELVVCPWCVSVYLSAGVLALRLFLPLWWTPISIMLAGSAVAGLLSSWE